LPVKVAEQGEKLLNGTAYFAPDGHHLEIDRKGGYLIARLITGAPISGFCPSITALLHSVAKVSGKNAVGVLLTGMGSDGAQGLVDLKNAKGHTVIQDEQSCVIFGMGGIAQSLGGVEKVVTLENMADYLVNIVRRTVQP